MAIDFEPIIDFEPLEEEEDLPAYGLRPDGTPKGRGWLGPIRLENGQVATELSVGVSLNGKERLIPAIVPGLTNAEIEYMKKGGDPRENKQIMDKAIAHARRQLESGKSPFVVAAAQTSAQQEDLPAWEKLLKKYKPIEYAVGKTVGSAGKTLWAAGAVSAKEKSAGLAEGVIPFLPKFVREDVTHEMPKYSRWTGRPTGETREVTFEGLESKLKTRAEKIEADIDPEKQERVQQALQGPLWPGEKWHTIDPELVPEAVNRWAAHVGDQAAYMVQMKLDQLAGTAATTLLTKSPMVGKIAGLAIGAIRPIANETNSFMEAAEFWGITDKKIVEENARLYGLGSGLIEYTQNLLAWGPMKKALKLPAERAAKLVPAIALTVLKEMGIAGVEGLEEVSQSGLERRLLRRAAKQMESVDPNFQTPDIPDNFAGWKETFAVAAGTSAILRGGGHAISGSMQHLYAQEKVRADQAAESELMQEPQPQTFRPEPQIMPEADVEDIKLQAEGEAKLTAEEQTALGQLEAEPEAPTVATEPDPPLDKLRMAIRKHGLDPERVLHDELYAEQLNLDVAASVRLRRLRDKIKSGTPVSEIVQELQKSPAKIPEEMQQALVDSWKRDLISLRKERAKLISEQEKIVSQAIDWFHATWPDAAEHSNMTQEKLSELPVEELWSTLGKWAQTHKPGLVDPAQEIADRIEKWNKTRPPKEVDVLSAIVDMADASQISVPLYDQWFALQNKMGEINARIKHWEKELSPDSPEYIAAEEQLEDELAEMKWRMDNPEASNVLLSEDQETAAAKKARADLNAYLAERRKKRVIDSGEKDRMIVGGGEKGVVKGKIKPHLYIGNVTPRAKKIWAEILNKARKKEALPGEEISPKDVGPHTEGGLPTKRTGVELTVDEARNLEGYLTDAMDEALEAGGPWTSHALAMLKALWGDIKEVRQSLGLPTGRMPFKVIHRGKTKIAVIPSVTERIYTAIKGPSKKTLADLSPSDLVTEGEAIKAGLRKVAAAAKHAFSVGGKEAAAKLRQQARELKRKARAIKLAKIARKGLATELMRKVSSRVDPYYRQAIQSIMDRVDPTNRSQATQDRMDALAAAIQQDPQIVDRITNPADMRLLKNLGKVPLNRMSTRQLEALVDERRRLHQEGKLKVKLTEKTRKQQEKGFIQDGIAVLKTVPTRRRIAEGQAMDNATWFQRLWDKWRGLKGKAGFGPYRLDRMAEYLDGFKRGFFTQIWEKTKTDLHTSRERRSIRAREFVQAMKDMGINGAEWMLETIPFRKSDGTTHNLTPWKMLGAYIQSHHATGNTHLIEGNEFSEQDLTEIAKLVETDPKLASMHRWMVERQREQWKALTNRLRAIGVDPTKFIEIMEYLPLMIADVDMIEQDDVLQRFLGQFVPQELLPKGFLKERKEGARQPIELDAMVLYMHSIDQVEHMMAMAPILNRLGSMLNDADFRQALNNVTYGKGADIWTQWLMDIGRDRVIREQHWYDQIVHYMQRNAVLYAIGWNLPSVLKQIPALFVGFAEDPRMMTFLTDNMVALSSQERFKEFRDEAWKRSSVLRHRSIEPELRAMWNRPHLQAMMKRSFGKRATELDASATSWMRGMDDWLTTLAWKCRYDAALSEGYDEKAAIRLADQTVQKTQQMASPEDLPHLFRGGAIASILNLFQNQSNQELNYWVHDIYGKAIHGRITPSQAAWRVMMAAILPIAVFNVVSSGGGGDDEDKQPFYVTAACYLFGNLPMVGSLAKVIVNKHGGGADLWEMPLEGAQQTWSGVQRGDVKATLKGGAKVVAGVLPTKGLINAQAVRTIEGAYDLTTGETDDLRRLIWSKTMLDEKEKKKSKKAGWK